MNVKRKTFMQYHGSSMSIASLTMLNFNFIVSIGNARHFEVLKCPSCQPHKTSFNFHSRYLIKKCFSQKNQIFKLYIRGIIQPTLKFSFSQTEPDMKHMCTS
ncbi:CLUMA_CG013223, isoform A [Clunio marinus]|uniref:CLUMA_CG013223, isoform A n=1 Tax=Clunio marinus TaxID=568069 RepID=A0A1J1IIA2_9DIPT|nr:CLUMA_CG013223, isoform A [Clunio marinus]